MDATFSCDNYGQRLLGGLQMLQDTLLLCDLTLVAEHQSIRVHRAVMAAASDYFRAILTLDMCERDQEEIVLKGVPAKGLKAIVGFAYTGQLRCTADNISDILLAATHLQFTDAIELCSKYLTSLTTKTNSVDMYTLAEQFNLVPLQERSLSIMLSHFEEIAEKEDFMKFHVKFLSNILADNRLKISSELKLFELVLKWVNSLPEERQAVIYDMMCKVRLPLIPPQDLVEVVMKEAVMKTDPQCLELLLEANKYHMLPDKQPLMQNERTQVRTDVPSIIMLDIDDEGPRVLDLSNKNWGTLQYSHLETFHAQVCVLDNYMYVCGGIELCSSNNPVSGKSYRYDPRFDTWGDIALMQEPRHHFTLVSDGISIFAIGGYCSGSFKNVVEQYNVHEDQWITKSPMDVRLSAAASATHFGKIFISGGQTDRGISRCVWCYHIGIDRWYGKSSMLQARMDHAMCCYSNKLFVMGGYDKNIIKAYDVDTVESYDIETDQWSVIHEGGPKISGIYSCLISTQVYMVGGFSYDENKKRNEVWCYNVSTNEWHCVSRIHSPAMSVPCCSLFLPRHVLRNITV